MLGMSTSLLPLTVSLSADAPSARLVEVRKIWDGAPHSAFTDLVRFKGRWLCVFREGSAHVSPDGSIRVIASSDGVAWESLARLTLPNADLRDPKITVTPSGLLMLTAAGTLHKPAAHRHQSFVWFSLDGREWGTPVEVCDPDMWLWRVTWHQGTAYGIAYNTTVKGGVRLYKSRDGRTFQALADDLFREGYPNESSLVFLKDNTCLAVLRRDEGASTAMLGVSKPPYTCWEWKDLGVRIGGPHIAVLPDGRIVAAGRRYDGSARTSLMWLDAKKGRLDEFLALPSGGDTSYPGLVYYEGILWVSYYSSHEGKTSIYLAKVRLPTVVPEPRG
ncbi:MAG: sialidase family protein [Armatimonadota bacterium]